MNGKRTSSARSTPLRAVAVFCVLLATPAAAELPAPKPPLPSTQNPPALALPVDCIVGATCYIQNFVDADPGQAARDFRCNPLSYDGHKGTDFALPTTADMARGVSVLAAAAGRVKGVRDGMEDGAYLANPDSIQSRECGNGLVIDHGSGWQTQYCHLRKNSLLVRPGQHVTPGTPLGLIGQSGLAEFPHLHFSVRFNRRPIDPFNPDNLDACAEPPPTNLWQSPAPAYAPGGVLRSGFALERPKYETIRAGAARAFTLPAKARQISLWGFAFGARAGDEIRLEIFAPDGAALHHKTYRIPRNIALLSRITALRRPGHSWPPGRYRGEITLLRQNQLISQQVTTLIITP